MKNILIFYILLVYQRGVRGEYFSAINRIGPLYREKWDHICNFCSQNTPLNDESGNYTFRMRLTSQSRKPTNAIQYHIFTEEQWKLQQEQKLCYDKGKIAFESKKIIVPFTGAWSDTYSGGLQKSSTGLYYLTLSDCDLGIKQQQFDVGFYEFEFTYTSGDSQIDFRFKDVLTINIIFAILLILILLLNQIKKRLYSYRYQLIYYVLIAQLSHYILEIMNYYLQSSFIRSFSDELTEFASLSLQFILAFIGWGMFTVTLVLPNQELNRAFVLMVYLMQYALITVFGNTMRQKNSFYPWSGAEGYIQLIFKLAVCLFGSLGLNLKFNPLWKSEKSKINKQKFAQKCVLLNYFYFIFQVLCFYYVNRQPECIQLTKFELIQNFGFIIMILMFITYGKENGEYTKVLIEQLPN